MERELIIGVGVRFLWFDQRGVRSTSKDVIVIPKDSEPRDI